MRLGGQDRLMFRDAMPQADLVSVYNAADLLVHPSLREGWPNVLLEAMACGTPVIATDVGGTREIVSAAVAGGVVPDRSEHSLASAVLAMVKSLPYRDAVRQHAASFGWEAVAEQHRRVLQQAITDAHVDSRRRIQCAT